MHFGETKFYTAMAQKTSNYSLETTDSRLVVKHILLSFATLNLCQGSLVIIVIFRKEFPTFNKAVKKKHNTEFYCCN